MPLLFKRDLCGYSNRFRNPFDHRYTRDTDFGEGVDELEYLKCSRMEKLHRGSDWPFNPHDRIARRTDASNGLYSGSTTIQGKNLHFIR